MGLMLTFGLIDVTAMVVLTAVCAIEKVWSRGTQFARSSVWPHWGLPCWTPSTPRSLRGFATDPP